MPDWLQVAVVVAVVIAAAVLVTRRMDDVWAGLRQRVAESPDTVDDAISDAIDVLDGWPTDDECMQCPPRLPVRNEPDDELCCGCGECWPQTPTGLPRRVPTGAHDLLDVQPMERAQEIAQLEALFNSPPIIPGRTDV